MPSHIVLISRRILPVLLAGSLTVAGPVLAASDSGAQKVKSKSSQTCTNPSPSHMKFSDMTVGFSQQESLQNPFRAEETRSIKAEAKKKGVKRLIYANASGDQAKQVSDIQSMIAQGADALIVAPMNATGLQSVFKKAMNKGIPVVTIDRHTAGTFCENYITFMGSDFHKQAVRAAKALVDGTSGKVRIAMIQGAYGNSVETARTKGFDEVIAKHDRMKVVAKQSAGWSTTKAQKVVSKLLLSHPDLNAIYTHSDTMALGAIKALKQYGKKPGQDVKIVTIDGTKKVVQMVAKGKVLADIETNPRFGPLAFKAIKKWVNGEPVDQQFTIADQAFTQDNAKQKLKSGDVY